MRKANKTTFLVVTVLTIAFVFAWKAYEFHSGACEPLLAANIDALSDEIDNDESASSNPFDTYYVKGDKKGKCIRMSSKRNVCPERGTGSGNHGNNCEIITFSADVVGFTYERKTVYAIEVAFYDRWLTSYGNCPSNSTEYDLRASPLVPASEHTYAE
ncbi:MAG: hypothetical protein ACI3ZB_04555 [Prevotella sp.]